MRKISGKPTSDDRRHGSEDKKARRRIGNVDRRVFMLITYEKVGI